MLLLTDETTLAYIINQSDAAMAAWKIADVMLEA